MQEICCEPVTLRNYRETSLVIHKQHSDLNRTSRDNANMEWRNLIEPHSQTRNFRQLKPSEGTSSNCPPGRGLLIGFLVWSIMLNLKRTRKIYT